MVLFLGTDQNNKDVSFADFYLAMLCIYRGLCCRKMSVHLYVTRRYSAETAIHVIKLFFHHRVATSF